MKAFLVCLNTLLFLIVTVGSILASIFAKSDDYVRIIEHPEWRNADHVFWFGFPLLYVLLSATLSWLCGSGFRMHTLFRPPILTLNAYLKCEEIVESLSRHFSYIFLCEA